MTDNFTVESFDLFIFVTFPLILVPSCLWFFLPFSLFIVTVWISERKPFHIAFRTQRVVYFLFLMIVWISEKKLFTLLFVHDQLFIV